MSNVFNLSLMQLFENAKISDLRLYEREQNNFIPIATSDRIVCTENIITSADIHLCKSQEVVH